MLPTKFKANWCFDSGEEAKKKKKKKIFMIVAMTTTWISDRNDFKYFYQQVTSMLPTKFKLNRPFGSGEEAKNRFLRWPPWRPS